MKKKINVFYFLIVLLTLNSSLRAGDVIFSHEDDFNRPNNPSLNANASFNYNEQPLINASVQNSRALLKGDSIPGNSFLGTVVTHPINPDLTKNTKPINLKVTVKALNPGVDNSPNPSFLIGLKTTALEEITLAYNTILNRLVLSVKKPSMANLLIDFVDLTNIDVEQDNVLDLSVKGSTLTASIYPAGSLPPPNPQVALDNGTAFVSIESFNFQAVAKPEDGFFVEFDDLELTIRDNQAPEIDITLFPIGFTVEIKDADGIFDPIDGVFDPNNIQNNFNIGNLKVIVDDSLDLSSFILPAILSGLIQVQVIDSQTIVLGFVQFFPIFANAKIDITVCDQNGACDSDSANFNE